MTRGGDLARRRRTLPDWTLYEDVRSGSLRAFRALVAEHDPAMRRTAAIVGAGAGGDPAPDRSGAGAVDHAVLSTWRTALPGLDMFTWQTTLRAWLFGILVSYARASTGPDAAAHGAAGPGPGAGAAGPAAREPRQVRVVGTDAGVPWRSLAWSARWGQGDWAALDDAVAALAPGEREILWLHRAEGWDLQEVREALGLTDRTAADRADQAEREVTHRVCEAVGLPPGPGALDGVLALLPAARRDQGATPWGPLAAEFRQWRRARTPSFVRMFY